MQLKIMVTNAAGTEGQLFYLPPTSAGVDAVLAATDAAFAFMRREVARSAEIDSVMKRIEKESDADHAQCGIGSIYVRGAAADGTD